MKTLEDLGYKKYRKEFCQSIEYDEYINDECKIIVFWKSGEVSSFVDSGEDCGTFTKDELAACLLKMESYEKL